MKQDNPVTDGYTTHAWITKLREEGMTWREIADEFGVSSGLIWKFYHRGFIPKNNKLRAKLGLPLICPRCGEEIT